MVRPICRSSYASLNGIYFLLTNIDVAFDDNGRQTDLLMARLTGNVADVPKLFNRCGWQASSEGGATLPHQYTLKARQGAPEKD